MEDNRRIEEKNVSSLNDLTRFLEKNCTDGMTLFRGQPEDKPLLPKIARPEFKWEKSLLKSECDMFEEFKKRSRPFLDFRPESDWDWLALAQHHGMATRLLDWTKNPLAALWFVVREPKKNLEQRGVVWVFKVMQEDIVDANEKNSPFENNRTKVFQPNHITKRIVAQDGWFTVHKYVDSKKQFLRFDKLKDYKKCLIKLSIAADNFERIREQLEDCGISDASLFPDLDGLCRYIVWNKSKKRKGIKHTNELMRFDNESIKALTSKDGFWPKHHIKTEVGISVQGRRFIIDAIADGPGHYYYLIETKIIDNEEALFRAQERLKIEVALYQHYLKEREERNISVRCFLINQNFVLDPNAFTTVPVLKYDINKKIFVNRDSFYHWIYSENKR